MQDRGFAPNSRHHRDCAMESVSVANARPYAGGLVLRHDEAFGCAVLRFVNDCAL